MHDFAECSLDDFAHNHVYTGIQVIWQNLISQSDCESRLLKKNQSQQTFARRFCIEKSKMAAKSETGECVFGIYNAFIHSNLIWLGRNLSKYLSFVFLWRNGAQTIFDCQLTSSLTTNSTSWRLRWSSHTSRIASWVALTKVGRSLSMDSLLCGCSFVNRVTFG